MRKKVTLSGVFEIKPAQYDIEIKDDITIRFASVNTASKPFEAFLVHVACLGELQRNIGGDILQKMHSLCQSLQTKQDKFLELSRLSRQLSLH